MKWNEIIDSPVWLAPVFKAWLRDSKVVRSIMEGKVYPVDGGYTMPVTVYSNPSPPQARTLIAIQRRRQDHTYLRGLMVGQKVYVWDGSHLTHDDVLSSLLPDVARYSSDLCTFEIKNYTIKGFGPDGFIHHETKLYIAKAGDYDPERSPFVRNVITASDSYVAT